MRHFCISNWSTTFLCKENLKKWSSPPAEAELAGELATSNTGANLSLTFYNFSYPGRKSYFTVPHGVCSRKEQDLTVSCAQIQTARLEGGFQWFSFLFFFAGAQGCSQIQVGGTWQEHKNILIEHTESLRREQACDNVGPEHRYYSVQTYTAAAHTDVGTIHE